jgi:hypothetical protein
LPVTSGVRADGFSSVCFFSASGRAGPQQLSPEPQQPPVFVIDSKIAAKKPFFFPFSFDASFI